MAETVRFYQLTFPGKSVLVLKYHAMKTYQVLKRYPMKMYGIF